MPNPSWPVVTYEACFNVDPFDLSPPAAVWTSLPVVAWSHQTPSGRQYELARTEAATISVLLDNQDGSLDPSNASSPYWPNVVPYRQWRQRAAWTAANLLAGNLSTFEGGIGTWVNDTNATVVGTSAQAHSGVSSLQMTAVAGGDMVASHVSVGANGIPVTPGQQIVCWGWLRGPGRPGQMAVNWYDAGGVFLSTSFGVSQVDQATGFVLLLLDATAPASAAKAKVRCKVLGCGAGESHYLDDAGFGLGSSYPLVFGYVERWPQRWEGAKAWVDLVVVDALALLEGKVFRSCYDEEVLGDTPIAYYPLSEPAGGQTFGSIATTQQPTAKVVKSKYGAATVTAGEPSIVAEDPATCTSFAGANGVAKQGSVIQLAAGGYGPYTINQGGTGWAMECWFQAAAPVTDPGILITQVGANAGGGIIENGTVRLNTNGTLQVRPAGTSTPTSPRYDDNRPHHVVYTFAPDAITWHLFVDGAQVLTGVLGAGFGSNSPSPGWTLVGGLLTSGAQQEFLGTGAAVFVAHVGIYQHEISAAQALAHSQAGATAFAGELSGARFSRLLRYAAYQGPSAVDTGQSQMAPASLASSSPPGALQDVTVAENGNEYVAGDGTITFKQRSARWNTTAVATLGELETPYLGDVRMDFDPTFLFTRVEETRPGGVTVAAFDATSQKRYGPRTLPETPQINLDLEATDRASYQLAQYKDPKLRLPQVTIDPASNPALWPVALGTKIGDRLTVKRRPFGGPVISIDCFVEAIAHDVDFRADAPPRWRVTYLLSPAGATFQFWKLDDAVFGKLSSGNLISY